MQIQLLALGVRLPLALQPGVSQKQQFSLSLQRWTSGRVHPPHHRKKMAPGPDDSHFLNPTDCSRAQKIEMV